MDDESFSLLVPAELDAIHALKGEIGRHVLSVMETVVLVEQSFKILGAVKVAETTLSGKVVLNLLIRLGNDLRSIVVLAGIGMPMQAVSLAAGSFETAYALAYIAADDSRAQAWVDHDDPTKPFLPVRKLVAEVMVHLFGEANEERVEHHYRHYRQLCLAKHGNPLLARQHGATFDGEGIVLALGPNTSDVGVRALQFALEHSLGHSLLALGVLANVDPLLGANADFAREVERLNQIWSDLHQEALRRWGGEDPCKGRW